jgi:hypothetical protein
MTIRLGHGLHHNPLAPLIYRDAQPDGAILADKANKNDYPRIPESTIGKNGKVLFATELRKTNGDGECWGFGLKLSSNNARSWGPQREIYTHTIDTSKLNLGTFSPALPDGTVVGLFHYTDDFTGTTGTSQIFELKSAGGDYDAPWTPTDISDFVVKKSNADPAGLPSMLLGTDARWLYVMPTCSCMDANGDLLFGLVTRYTWGQVSRFVVIKRTTSTGVWSILGGLDDQVAANDWANESSLAMNASGHIVADLRILDNDDSGGLFRGYSVSAGGVNWSTMVLRDGIASTLMPNGNVKGSLRSNPANRDEMYLLACGFNSAATRAKMTLYKSTDGGITFPSSSVLFWRYAGYPALEVMNNGELLCAFEATDNFADYGAAWQVIKQVRALPADIGGNPHPIHYQFNEWSSGAVRQGAAFIDHGGGDYRGLAITGQLDWTYDANGIVSSGATRMGITDAALTADHPFRVTTGSFEFEVVANFAAATGVAATIAGNRSTSGAGWLIAYDANKAPLMTLASAGSSVTVTGTGTDLSVGLQPKTIRGKRDVVAGKVYLYVDGVEVGAVGGTAEALGTIAVSTVFTIGGNTAGSALLPAGIVIREMRFTPYAITNGDYLTASTPKTPLATFCGFNPTLPPNKPTSLASCKMWLNSLGDGGFHGVADTFRAGPAPWAMPPAIGMAFDNYIDPVSGLRFEHLAPVLADYDTTVGSHFYHHVRSDNVSAQMTTPSNPVLDFLHQTALGTLIFAVKWVANAPTGGEQWLQLSTDNTAPGLRLSRKDADGKLRVRLRRTGAFRFDVTGAWPTVFANGVWYLIAVVFNGASQPLTLKYATFPGNRQAPTALTSVNSAASVDATDNADASTGTITFHSINWVRSLDLMAFNAVLNDAQILSETEFMLWRASERRSRRNRMPIFLGR